MVHFPEAETAPSLSYLVNGEHTLTAPQGQILRKVRDKIVSKCFTAESLACDTGILGKLTT